MNRIIASFIGLIFLVCISVQPAYSARETNSFDGNIFPIYAGNGSMVPPASSISKSINNKRTSVIFYYLDDSATSKQYAPVISGLKLLWTTYIDIIPITTDELEGVNTNNKNDPAYYWHGNIPQVVILNGDGEVQLDKEGQIPIDQLNEAISKASGLNKPDFNITIKSFNEYNSEASKDGYTDPR